MDPFTGELTQLGLATLRTEEIHLEEMRRLSTALSEARYVGSAFQTQVDRQIRYREPSSAKETRDRLVHPAAFHAAWDMHNPFETVSTAEALDRIRERHELRNMTDPKYRQDTKAIRDCRQVKQERRNIIHATGHGGRNGVTEYKKHEEC